MTGPQGDRHPGIATPLAAVNLRASMCALAPSPAAWDALEAAVVALVAWHMTPPASEGPPPPVAGPCDEPCEAHGSTLDHCAATGCARGLIPLPGLG